MGYATHDDCCVHRGVCWGELTVCHDVGALSGNMGTQKDLFIPVGAIVDRCIKFKYRVLVECVCGEAVCEM